MNQNLTRAANTLCRTSPHLRHEFLALKQGLQTHNFLNGGLEEIICEHVKITGLGKDIKKCFLFPSMYSFVLFISVANALQKLPLEARLNLQQLKLSERVNELISSLEGSANSTTHNESSTTGEASNSHSHRKRMRR